ncbi:MAG: hypothetical protein QG584_1866 [Pseudomonadota bacterium]|uniref:Uncharacterized protein n=1 Tax=Candidatus Proximibacter danicus TaxID=2954365 RepID=A0A9D7K3G1_9PROT|nr:hypothetical protein [Candidatus Proximibacter danicus]MDQ5879357.1 hypothetical protein [Pseudomonadota bacterium]MDQ5915973.1 hypothetical protein [Pseudomonadota bacterium]MDQ5943195.1 hypothetical protein [Pseudomonadota bacterium]MDQ5947332.1 hypothetical protein [Pseudomonadota bacterium]
MEPKDLVCLPRGTRLSDVVQQPCEDAFLSPSIYRIGAGIYLRASQFRPGSLEKDPSGPFVTGIVLAAGDGSARRALLMDIESDDGKTMSVPASFLPSGGVAATTYGEILRGLKKEKPRVCQETAAYRIALDGRFIHRMIETERFLFLFRSSEHDDSEAPYAVVRKLL